MTLMLRASGFVLAMALVGVLVACGREEPAPPAAPPGPASTPPNDEPLPGVHHVRHVQRPIDDWLDLPDESGRARGFEIIRKWVTGNGFVPELERSIEEALGYPYELTEAELYTRNLGDSARVNVGFGREESDDHPDRCRLTLYVTIECHPRDLRPFLEATRDLSVAFSDYLYKNGMRFEVHMIEQDYIDVPDFRWRPWERGPSTRPAEK